MITPEMQQVTRLLVISTVGVALLIWFIMLMRRPRAFAWDEMVTITNKPSVYHYGNVHVGRIYPVWCGRGSIQPIAIIDKIGGQLEIGVFPIGGYRSGRKLPFSEIIRKGWVTEIPSDQKVTADDLRLEPWVSNSNWQPNSF